QFDVSPGMSITVIANAWVTGDTGEDSFEFEYSAGGSAYAPLFTVSGDNADAIYMEMLPSSVSGSVTIRATDTNRDQGARSLERLNVNQLVIRTESDPEATAPAAPSAIGVSASSHSMVTVTWTDNANDESGFRIERSDNGAPFAAAGTVGADTSVFEDPTVSADTAYRYRVAAYNGAGESSWAESNSVTTPSAPPGPSLTATGYKVKGKQAVDLDWSGAAGAVDIARDGTVIATLTSDQNGSGAWTDNIGVKGGGSYAYKVCDAGTSDCSDVQTIVF
ncbi:MAG: fibronectin type III domain-containing protein, partial [Gammaproteobacteria bacterium]